MAQRTPARRDRWAPLREELARWQEAGLSARFWLRDDDAVTVTPALTRLAELCASHAVPCLIAAIPSQADENLAAYLASQELAEVAVHGWCHRNHAGPKAKSEFPAGRPRPEVLHELGIARARIDALFGGKALPIYVPPWNRIAPAVAALLPEAGFRALSAKGRAPILGFACLEEINVHVDIIDWHGSRGGRDPESLVAELASHLAWSRENGQPAVGILSHHLMHDELAWQFLDQLFRETDQSAVRWSRASDLIGL